MRQRGPRAAARHARAGRGRRRPDPPDRAGAALSFRGDDGVSWPGQRRAHGGDRRRHRARRRAAGLGGTRAGLGAGIGAPRNRRRQRLHGLRLPPGGGRPAAHRDQHQCRRRPAECRAGAGAVRLLRGGGGHAAGRASGADAGAGLCRHVPRGMARGAGRGAASPHRHRGRGAAIAVPLSGIPALPQALRAPRHRRGGLRSARAAHRRRGALARRGGPRPGLQSPDGISAWRRRKMPPCARPGWPTRRC